MRSPPEVPAARGGTIALSQYGQKGWWATVKHSAYAALPEPAGHVCTLFPDSVEALQSCMQLQKPTTCSPAPETASSGGRNWCMRRLGRQPSSGNACRIIWAQLGPRESDLCLPCLLKLPRKATHIQPAAWGARRAAKAVGLALQAASCTCMTLAEKLEKAGEADIAHLGPMLGPEDATGVAAGRLHPQPPHAPFLTIMPDTSACLHQEGISSLHILHAMACRQAGHLLPAVDPWLMKAVAARWTAALRAAGADRQQRQH